MWDGKIKNEFIIVQFILDIKDEKIWIQCNSTDIDIAEELVNLGVEKQDIVLGFQPLYMRKYTDYAVN